jgi:hypothetical protein
MKCLPGCKPSRRKPSPPATCSTTRPCAWTPFYALVDAPELQHWGQFVFDRGQLDARGGTAGRRHQRVRHGRWQGHGPLAQAIAAQLAQVLRLPELAQPAWSQLITEKRATFASTPDLRGPATPAACRPAAGRRLRPAKTARRTTRPPSKRPCAAAWRQPGPCVRARRQSRLDGASCPGVAGPCQIAFCRTAHGAAASRLGTV